MPLFGLWRAAASHTARRDEAPLPVIPDPADLAAQHHILMPEHQELATLEHLTPGTHHHAAEQTTREQVDDREYHLAMMPTRAGRPSQIQ